MKIFDYFMLLGFVVALVCADDDESDEEDTEDEPKIRFNHKINTRPIIGILSQQSKPVFEPNINQSTSYIAASYVKWIEAAGGQSVPILNTYTKRHILKIMSRINGVLIPGGDRDLYDSNYGRVASIMYNEVLRYNDQGTFFPMWGTCLGFQALCVNAAQAKYENGTNRKILRTVEAKRLMRPITFTDKAFTSRLMKKAPWSLIQTMSTKNVAIHMHKYGVVPDHFKWYKGLRDMFDILATAVGRNGEKLVSMIESKKYPIWGTQFHPEKNQFEWTRTVDFNHEPEAIRFSQYFSMFFVNQARTNIHEFESFEEEEKHMMFNYQMVYSGDVTAFQQVYGFGNRSESYIH